MKLYITIVLLLANLVQLWAQPARNERMESLRIAYITEKLNLTPDEAQKFWPIYNEFRTKEEKIDPHRNIKPNQLESLSDKELDELVEKNLKADEERVKLKREYYTKLKKAIPTRKIVMLQRLEKEFKRELLERIRDERRKEKD